MSADRGMDIYREDQIGLIEDISLLWGLLLSFVGSSLLWGLLLSSVGYSQSRQGGHCQDPLL